MNALFKRVVQTWLLLLCFCDEACSEESKGHPCETYLCSASSAYLAHGFNRGKTGNELEEFDKMGGGFLFVYLDMCSLGVSVRRERTTARVSPYMSGARLLVGTHNNGGRFSIWHQLGEFQSETGGIV